MICFFNKHPEYRKMYSSELKEATTDQNHCITYRIFFAMRLKFLQLVKSF